MGKSTPGKGGERSSLGFLGLLTSEHLAPSDPGNLERTTAQSEDQLRAPGCFLPSSPDSVTLASGFSRLSVLQEGVWLGVKSSVYSLPSPIWLMASLEDYYLHAYFHEAVCLPQR